MSNEFNYPSSAVDIGLTEAAIFVTNASNAVDTQAADHDCKRALIKAFTSNTGLVWINLGVAAVQQQCCPIDAGESVNVPISNTDKIHANFAVANEKIAVLYSN